MQSNRNFISTATWEMYDETGIGDAYRKYCGRLRLEDVFTTETVYMCACRAASGFRDRPDTQAFMRAGWRNSQELCERVLSGKYVPKYYREREINERGHIRVIRPPVFECKVVQKVLDDFVIRPALECRMAEHSYASVTGGGTDTMHAKILEALHALTAEERKTAVIAMTDYSGYFASVDTARLEREIAPYVTDKGVLKLFRAFCPEEKGLWLGNETSQIPASFFPTRADKMLEEAGVPEFRFMDDTLFIAGSMEQAAGLVGRMKEVARELKITVKDEKTKFVEYGKPFVFCKQRYLPTEVNGYYMLTNPKTVRTEAAKLRAFARKVAAGEMDIEKADEQYRGVRGVLKSKPNSWKSVARLDRLHRELLHGKPPENKNEKEKAVKTGRGFHEKTNRYVVMAKDRYGNVLGFAKRRKTAEGEERWDFAWNMALAEKFGTDGEAWEKAAEIRGCMGFEGANLLVYREGKAKREMEKYMGKCRDAAVAEGIA